MRYLFGFLCVCAVGLMPLVGCDDAEGGGGNGGSAGDGGSGGAIGQEFPCTEQGIRDAIAEGGGPHTFACDGPQTVVTQATIEIGNDVILDGEGDLIVDGGNEDADPERGHRVFLVAEGVEAELRGFTVSGGGYYTLTELGSSIENRGTLALTNVAVSENEAAVGNDGTMTMTNVTVSRNGAGVTNAGTLTMTNSTVSEPIPSFGPFGIDNAGTLTMSNTAISGPIDAGTGVGNDGGNVTMTSCTVSGYSFTVKNYSGMMTMTNTTVSGGLEGIENSGTLTMTNSTVSGHADFGIANGGTLTMTSSLVDGDCLDSVVTSNGYNIESPGDTCGFDPDGTDQVNVSADDLKLGELADNGGPTMTHALLPGSVAIDVIPVIDCVDAVGAPLTTDQRGQPRPAGTTDPKKCDVGAFEVPP